MIQTAIEQEPDYDSVLSVADRFEINREQLRKILGISESTQFRYEKRNRVLNSNLRDRWLRFVRVVNLAIDLFEDEAEVARWLSSPKDSLGGCIPLDLLASENGTKEVEAVLLQASYGIFA